MGRRSRTSRFATRYLRPDLASAGPAQRGALRTSRTGYVRVTYGVACGAWYGLRTVLGPYVARRTVRRTDPNFLKIKRQNPDQTRRAPWKPAGGRPPCELQRGRGEDTGGLGAFSLRPCPASVQKQALRPRTGGTRKGPRLPRSKRRGCSTRRSAVPRCRLPRSQRQSATWPLPLPLMPVLAAHARGVRD